VKHVIIGNGPAGVVAAEALRRHDAQAEIALIGDEAEPPYSRMALPYFLMGRIDVAGTHLRKSHDHYVKHGIHLIQGRVAKVDGGARQVEFEGGERLAYDRLLIATGSRPLRPPVPGMDLPGVHTCWTLDDARQIAARAKPGSRVLLIGAGFIGCIIMEALAARGVALTVVEMGGRMVPRMMTEKAGGLIRKWVEAKGVKVHVDTGVTAIAAKNGTLVAQVGGNGAVVADLVICAAGVRPNIGFLAGSGINTGSGIRVDASMRTNVEGIYAAGDVTEAAGFHSGKPELNAIQPNAADQARIAAANMALGKPGAPVASQGSLAINVLDTLGLISASFGQWWGEPGGESVELADEARYRYLSLQFGGEKLIGATAIGWTEHVGVLRGLIQGRVRLGHWKRRLLADPTQFMAAYLAAGQKAA